MKVVAVQNPLTSLEDDVAAANRVINAQTGPVVLVGHSMGAQVAIEIARSWPGLVKHLVVAAPAVNDREDTLFRQTRRLEEIN